MFEPTATSDRYKNKALALNHKGKQRVYPFIELKATGKMVIDRQRNIQRDHILVQLVCVFRTHRDTPHPQHAHKNLPEAHLLPETITKRGFEALALDAQA